MSEKGKRAKALFEQGYNCAQSVAGAFAEEMGLPLETVARLASPLGGGIGRMRETCGTVTGMMLVLGMAKGYADPKDAAAKKAIYARAQELGRRFREDNGSLVCRELLGLAKPEGDPTPEPRTAQYYKKRPCGELCEYAADLLAEELKRGAAS